MESPSPKRRKTSPSTSLDVNMNRTSIRPPNRDRRSVTPSRASYLSPTKASLARFHPNLLPSSTAPATRRLSSRGSQGPSNTPSSVIDGAQGPVNGIDTTARPVTPPRATTPSAVEGNRPVNGGSPIQNIELFGGGLSTAPRRRSRTPLRYAPATKRAVFDTRASPPAAMETDSARVMHNEEPGRKHLPQSAEILNLAAEEACRPGSALEEFELPTTSRTSGNGAAPGVAIEDGEPRLPSTPTQLGLEPLPEPPKGILLSSPSRRPKRKTRASTKSSPLKPRKSGTEEVVVDTQEQSNLGPRRYYSSIEEARISNVDSGSGIQQASGLDDPNSHAGQHAKPGSITHRLSLFLPFSKRPPPPVPRPPTPPRIILDVLLPSTTSDILTATEDTLKTSPSDDPLIRRKEITLTSPQSLLIVKLHVIINLDTKNLTEIMLSSISPWAASELGTWIRRPGVGRDLAAIRDATNEYWRLAELRAKCWVQCAEKFGYLLSGSVVADTPGSTKTGNRPKGRRKNPLLPLSTASDPFDPSDPSRQTLYANLHRTSFLLTQAPISLLISWRLAFNDSGKLESHVSTHAAFPESWVKAEGGKELKRVGEAFEGLLSVGVGVRKAVGVVVRAVFGKDDL